MALNSAIISPKPAITEVFDSVSPPMHWYGRAGGSWIPDHAIPYTWSGLVVHWEERKTPRGLSLAQAIERAGQVAYFHAFQRDWEEDVPGLQGSDGIQYHYYICGGHILQVTPETKHLWHASAANAWSLAICIAAGPGDDLDPANVTALEALLKWFCYGRPDLPLITAQPSQVMTLLPDGHTRNVSTHGILYHDEARKMEGLPDKGCCGVYKPVVTGWRSAAIATPS